MEGARTTAVVQVYLDRLAEDVDADAAVVRELLAGAANRLHVLCASLLRRSYPRLTRPPLGLAADEMLSAVVERLLKALREARPANVRQFFALANQHMRWELNDLARRLDEQPAAVEANESAVAAPEPSDSQLTPNTRRILQAIDGLPADEREVFGLVRIQDLPQNEVAELLGVSTKTVQRRLNRGLLLLSEALGDLRAGSPAPAED